MDTRLISRRIGSEPIVLISSKSNQDLPPGKIDLSTLPPQKLAIPWSMHSIRSNIERYIRIEELPVARQLEVDTLYIALDLVRRSDWMAIFPISALGFETSDIVAREIVSPEMVADFYMIRPARRTLPAAANIFLREVEAGLARILKTWQAAHSLVD